MKRSEKSVTTDHAASSYRDGDLDQPTKETSRVQEFAAALEADLGLFTLTETERARVRTKWGAHIPTLVLAIIHMIMRGGSLFNFLPFTARKLAALHAEVTTLGEIKAVLEQLMGKVSDTLLKRRSELHGHADQVVSSIYALRESPATSPESLALLDQIAAPVLAIVEERLASIVATRKSTLSAKAALRKQAEEQLQEVRADLEHTKAENRVLRGESLHRINANAPAAPARRARTRSTRR